MTRYNETLELQNIEVKIGKVVATGIGQCWRNFKDQKRKDVTRDHVYVYEIVESIEMIISKLLRSGNVLVLDCSKQKNIISYACTDFNC